MITKVFRGRVDSSSSRMAVYASFDENIVNIVPVDEIVDEYYNSDGTITVKLVGGRAIGTFQVEPGGKGGYDWSQPPTIPDDAWVEGQEPPTGKKAAAGAGDAEARKKRAEKIRQLLREGKAPWVKS